MVMFLFCKYEKPKGAVFISYCEAKPKRASPKSVRALTTFQQASKTGGNVGTSALGSGGIFWEGQCT